MNKFYEKSKYLELVKKQTEVYGSFLDAIDLILKKLPDNGKRFGTKWFDAINEELKERKIVVRPYTSYSDIGIRIAYVSCEYVWCNSLEITPKYEYGKSRPKLYDSGIMRDKDACIEMLTTYKEERLKKYIKELCEVETKIDAFIDKWEVFDKISKELRGFNLQNIDIPYVGSCPISNK